MFQVYNTKKILFQVYKSELGIIFVVSFAVVGVRKVQTKLLLDPYFTTVLSTPATDCMCVALLVTKNWVGKCSYRTKLHPIFLNTNNSKKMFEKRIVEFEKYENPKKAKVSKKKQKISNKNLQISQESTAKKIFKNLRKILSFYWEVITVP